MVLYLGPANLGGTFSSEYFFGTGSRANCLDAWRLCGDFPITGGGLGAFPVCTPTILSASPTSMFQIVTICF